MPLVEVKSWLVGHRYISLPFTEHCPPLAVTRKALRDLISGTARWSVEVADAPVELHAEAPEQKNVHAGTVGFRHVLELDSDPERLFGSFKREIRKAVHKAERSHIEVHLGQSRADIETYFRMHCDTRHRLGVLVQPKRFFVQLWEKMLSRGLGFTALAYKGREPIAGEVFLALNGHLMAMYGASDPAHWELRPNNLVMWKAIEWGCARGYRDLDLGRTDLDQPGLRNFKRRWGASEDALVYTTIARRSAAPGPSLSRAIVPVIRRAPSGVARVAGELLSKHLPEHSRVRTPGFLGKWHHRLVGLRQPA